MAIEGAAEKRPEKSFGFTTSAMTAKATTRAPPRRPRRRRSQSWPIHSIVRAGPPIGAGARTCTHPRPPNEGRGMPRPYRYCGGWPLEGGGKPRPYPLSVQRLGDPGGDLVDGAVGVYLLYPHA